MAPHLISGDGEACVAAAKRKAASRVALEARIPPELFYRGGLAQRVPSVAEAVLLGDIRRQVSKLLGVGISFTQPDEIIAKFEAKLSAEPVVPAQIQYALAL